MSSANNWIAVDVLTSGSPISINVPFLSAFPTPDSANARATIFILNKPMGTYAPGMYVLQSNNTYKFALDLEPLVLAADHCSGIKLLLPGSSGLSELPARSVVFKNGKKIDVTSIPSIPLNSPDTYLVVLSMDGNLSQVNADWTAASGPAHILNKPILGTASAASASDFATAAQGAKADSAVQPDDLSEVATSGSYESLHDKPSIPAAQVPSDWDATSGPSHILNKPVIPAAQVNADWNATTGSAQILNKPAIPAAQVQVDWNSTSGVTQILNKPTIGTAASAATTDFATAAQGTKADSAVQPAALNTTLQGYLLLSGGHLTGPLTNGTNGNSTASGLKVSTANGASSLNVYPALTSGSYNGTVQAGDAAIIAGSSLDGAGALTVGLWSSAATGLRVTPTGVQFPQRPTFAGNTPYDTGNLTIGDYLTKVSAASSYLAVNGTTTVVNYNGTAGTWRGVTIQTGGVTRWNVGTDVADTGGGAGSDLRFYRYNDSGGFINAALSISRLTGQSTFSTRPAWGSTPWDSSNLPNPATLNLAGSPHYIYFPFTPAAGVSGQIGGVAIPRPMTIPATFAGSTAYADIPASGSVVYELRKNGVAFATLNFLSGSNNGTFLSVGQNVDTTFTTRDRLDIVYSAGAVGPLAGLHITVGTIMN